MITEIIQEGGRVETPITELCFWHKGQHGNWGFCFPCNARGVVNVRGLQPEARRNYEKCISGQMPDVEQPGEIRHAVCYTRLQKIGRCECGSRVCLDHFTNTCEKCGRDYNFAGSELAQREQWGEETGEHPCECV